MTITHKNSLYSGYTLVELIIAIGLFSIIMTLSSGAYLMMIGLNRQAQGIATGINDLSFAIETMTRDIRTGSLYSCGIGLGLGDCPLGSSSFSFKNKDSLTVSYGLSGSSLQKTINADRMYLPTIGDNLVALLYYLALSRRRAMVSSRALRLSSGTVSIGAGRHNPSRFKLERR